jgi:hypothetical protein
VSVALGIQHAMRIRHIAICDLSEALPYFFHGISKTARFSGGGGWEVGDLLNIKCVLISLQRSREKFLVLRRTERDMIKKIAYWPSCKVPLFLPDFNEV